MKKKRERITGRNKDMIRRLIGEREKKKHEARQTARKKESKK